MDEISIHRAHVLRLDDTMGNMSEPIGTIAKPFVKEAMDLQTNACETDDQRNGHCERRPSANMGTINPRTRSCARGIASLRA